MNFPQINSISAYKSFGVKPSTLQHMMLNLFHFPENFSDCLDKYFILHWTSKHTLEQITEGILERDGIRYVVIFHSGTRFDIRNAAKCKLSFRKAKKDFCLPSYVLIKAVTE